MRNTLPVLVVLFISGLYDVVSALSIIPRRRDTRSPISLQSTTHDSLSVSRRRYIISSALVATCNILSPQQSNAAIRDPKTGILLPTKVEIETSIPTTYDDDENPMNGDIKTSFARLDSTPDTIFYKEARFVEHVDEQAVKSMTSYISDTFLQPNDSVLDLCSSWTSHIRPDIQLKRVAGLGMNDKELEANKVLTERTVMDLNVDKNVKLPYEDDSFDKIILQLSIDYLIHPLEVMKESSRVLKKGGKIAILFSNRLFLSKAVGLWSGKDDVDHAYTVGSYLYFSQGGFTDIKAIDLSTRKGRKDGIIIGDPLYVVTATKS